MIPPSPHPTNSPAVPLYFGFLNSNALSSTSCGYHFLTPNQVARLFIVALNFKYPYSPLNANCAWNPEALESVSDSLKVCLISNLLFQHERKLQQPGGGSPRASAELAVKDRG